MPSSGLRLRGAGAHTEQFVATIVRPGEFEGTVERARYDGAFEIRSLTAHASDQPIGRHSHDQAHFFLVLSGTYLSSARGAPEAACAPFLVFDPPGTTHEDRFADDHRGAFLTVSLGEAAFAAAAAGLPDRALALQHAGALSAALTLAREVSACGQDEAQIEAWAWTLVGAVEDDATADLALPGWAHRAFEAVMDEAAEAGRGVAAIAGLVGVHPVHLARVFRQAFGCTPAELLRWRRLERAADLLARTRRPLAEVAAEAGFVDQAHMTRAFRARFGVPPGRWRRARHVAPIQDGTAQAA